MSRTDFDVGSSFADGTSPALEGGTMRRLEFAIDNECRDVT